MATKTAMEQARDFDLRARELESRARELAREAEASRKQARKLRIIALVLRGQAGRARFGRSW